MLIKVTKEDIDKGEPDDSDSCAIALAIKRQTGLDDVEVDGFFHKNLVQIKVGNDRYEFISQKVMKFIMDFDAGEGVAPFKFRLRGKL